MSIEIERKFLVSGTKWRNANGVRVVNGYLSLDKKRSVRVRLQGEKAYLTIKGPSNGASRIEFEYKIPFNDARQLLKLCDGSVIQKIRHVISYKGFKWEVDEFLAKNKGLVLAEIELKREDQPFERPCWVGKEVTQDSRYYNVNLSVNPYCTWMEC